MDDETRAEFDKLLAQLPLASQSWTIQEAMEFKRICNKWNTKRSKQWHKDALPALRFLLQKRPSAEL